MKAIMNYPGSKWNLASWIINFFPGHHSYLEPFSGSAAVLFSKQRSNIETINDLDGNIINLFSCIKKDPKRLADEIYFTPYAREIYENTYTAKPKNDFERAVQFYIRLSMDHGYRTTGERVGWKMDIQGRERAYTVKDWCNIPSRILEAAERLKQVQIEKRPAIELIEKFNFENVLIYCDPPYLLNTRHGIQYKKEMTNEEHEFLLEVIKNHKGYVLISGYDSILYNDVLRNWHREEMISYTQSNKMRKEVLWMNFIPNQQIRMEEYIDSISADYE